MEERLIVTDIDGCLTAGEGQPLLYPLFQTLTDLNRRARRGEAVPAVTLCTGRPTAYVEGVMQAIDGFLPAVCEHGAMLYVPEGHRFLRHSALDEAARTALAEIKAMLEREVVEAGLGYLQPGKETSLTLFPVGPIGTTSLEPLHNRLAELVARTGAPYAVIDTFSCVNLVPRGLNKGQGVRWLAEMIDVPLAQMAGIGDSDSDLAFLQLVSTSAAPINATPTVRQAVDYVSPCSNGEGFLDILFHWGLLTSPLASQ